MWNLQMPVEQAERQIKPAFHEADKLLGASISRFRVIELMEALFDGSLENVYKQKYTVPIIAFGLFIHLSKLANSDDSDLGEVIKLQKKLLKWVDQDSLRVCLGIPKGGKMLLGVSDASVIDLNFSITRHSLRFVHPLVLADPVANSYVDECTQSAMAESVLHDHQYFNWYSRKWLMGWQRFLPIATKNDSRINPRFRESYLKHFAHGVGDVANGNLQAQVELAKLAYERKDYKAAMNYASIAAGKDHTEACYLAALITGEGKSHMDIPKNLFRKWYQIAADAGHREAMNNLAVSYIDDETASEEEKLKASELYVESARLGNQTALQNFYNIVLEAGDEIDFLNCCSCCDNAESALALYILDKERAEGGYIKFASNACVQLEEAIKKGSQVAARELGLVYYQNAVELHRLYFHDDEDESVEELKKARDEIFSKIPPCKHCETFHDDTDCDDSFLTEEELQINYAFEMGLKYLSLAAETCEQSLVDVRAILLPHSYWEYDADKLSFPSEFTLPCDLNISFSKMTLPFSDREQALHYYRKRQIYEVPDRIVAENGKKKYNHVNGWLKTKIASIDEPCVLTNILKEAPTYELSAMKKIWKSYRFGFIRSGDEFWSFSSPQESWENMAGRAGVCVVRNGKVIFQKETLVN